MGMGMGMGVGGMVVRMFSLSQAQQMPHSCQLNNKCQNDTQDVRGCILSSSIFITVGGPLYYSDYIKVKVKLKIKHPKTHFMGF